MKKIIFILGIAFIGTGIMNTAKAQSAPKPESVTIAKLPGSSKRILIAWGKTTSPKYEIYRNNEFIAETEGEEASATKLCFIDSVNLVGGIYYCYRVRGVDGTDKSEFSEQVCAEFDPDPVGIIQQKDAGLSIYPNPVNDIFFVEYEESVLIKLYDILGKEVLSQNVKGKTEINISNLPQGVYSVSVFSDKREIANRKIVKL